MKLLESLIDLVLFWTNLFIAMTLAAAFGVGFMWLVFHGVDLVIKSLTP